MKTINLAILKQLEFVGQDLIDFIINNKLEELPLSLLEQVKGFGHIASQLRRVGDCTVKCDTKGNVVHYKGLFEGYISEWWKEYDAGGNTVYYKNNFGGEYWKEYDSNNNMIYYKNSCGEEKTYSYKYHTSGTLKSVSIKDTVVLEIPEF